MIDLAAFRRDLHAHPETGFDLERTSSLIATELERAGLEVVRDVGRTGVVATLRRGPDETAIGFRADMDALPIQETTNLPYRSKTEGKFHGCGHDGHSTMLLGAALKLAADPTLARTIHFIFQPDEENGNGASAMIADGLFERFPMGAIFGLHNMPGMELGHFATQAGPFCAFEDNFEIRIQGQGGHASMPEKGVDPIVTGVRDCLAAAVGRLALAATSGTLCGLGHGIRDGRRAQRPAEQCNPAGRLPRVYQGCIRHHRAQNACHCRRRMRSTRGGGARRILHVIPATGQRCQVPSR